MGALTDNMVAKSQEQIYSEGYDAGYLNGYRCGLEDGWAQGFDAGVNGMQVKN
jgi:flagellar biosynthesis/type III secretory pathway protein FliH